MSRRVYSSAGGRVCPACDQPVAECRCGQSTTRAAGSGQVRVGRETKGRKGKGVTVITGLPLTDAELDALGKELKAKCGAGGKTRAGVIEIQGDHRDRIVGLLQDRGYAVKRSGG